MHKILSVKSPLNNVKLTITQPMLSPTNLKATLELSEVDFAWTLSEGAILYNIKRATSNSGPYVTISTSIGTVFTDTNVTAGTTYYYVVSAVNGNEETV